MITPVILSGGSGTRLWPLSTPELPKQFLNLVGPRSLFQMTLERCADRAKFAAPMIVGSAMHQALIEQQCREKAVSDYTLLLEPLARNTAPAIALAALAMTDPSAMLLVMPSDHVMTDVGKFLEAVNLARQSAADGMLVTFGITPDAPETGYGYIARGKTLAATGVYQAQKFVEKPAFDVAQAMLAEGGYFWNAGIFLFRADAYLAALETHAPAMLAACRLAMASARREGRSIFPDRDLLATSPSDSIDYAVMERAENVALVPVDPGWSDVGSWDALGALGPLDDHGNMLRGDTLLQNASGNIVVADGITICASAVENLIIIANKGHVLVLPKGRSQDVKAIAAAMKDRP